MLNYVLSLLEPDSAVAKEKLKSQQFFSDKQKLLDELNNVESALSILKNNQNAFDNINHHFSFVKDLNTSFNRLKNNNTLNELEMFEIKSFLLLTQKICLEYSLLNLNLKDINFIDCKDSYDLLNIGQNGTFFISDQYSQNLQNIRQKKQEINKKILLNKGEKYKKEHLEICVLEQDEENKILKIISDKLRPFIDDFIANSNLIARLDLIIKKAQLALKYNLAKPIISESLSLKGAVNPTISDFTPLDILTDSGVTVITGANMGGKTMALKTVFLNTALALLGYFCFANSAKIPFFEFVEFMANTTEEKGLSGFATEITKINSLYLNASNKKGLILIDEFGKGTNALEGAKLFKAVVKAFNETASTIIMTTHFDSVAVNAKKHYQVKGIKKSVLPITIDYGLIEVSLNEPPPKQAIEICRYLGLNKSILDRLE